MPHYLLSVHGADDESPDPTGIGDAESVHAWQQQARTARVLLLGGELVAASSATLLHGNAAGDVAMTDRPTMAADEELGCVWVIDAPHFDSALDWAARATVAYGRPVELRPFRRLT